MGNGNVEQLGDRPETTRRNTIGTVFVFLHLLECDVQLGADFRLRKTFLLAELSQFLADVLVSD